MAKSKQNNEHIKNYIIVALATTVVLLGINWVSDNLLNPTGAVAAPTEAVAAPTVPSVPTAPKIDVSKLDLELGLVAGDEDAEVVLYEFSDYQCPFCGRFYAQSEKQIKETFVDTGKVKFVYMDFPLDSIHPFARASSHAVLCAAEQGKEWELHDKILSNQRSLNQDNLKAWAKEVVEDAKKFDDCIANSVELDKRINAAMAAGQAAGVRGTPGFILVDKNGDAQLISGAQPYPVFESALNQALA